MQIRNVCFDTSKFLYQKELTFISIQFELIIQYINNIYLKYIIYFQLLLESPFECLN